MTSLKIEPGRLPASVQVPASKSYSNRALILAAQKGQGMRIKGLPASTDVTFLMDSLKAAGFSITQDQYSVVINNQLPTSTEKTIEILVGEGGTTARFLAALLLKTNVSYELVLGERLKVRPWAEFIDLAHRYGGQAELVGERLFLKGPLKLPSRLKVDCSKTTQFASGLRLAFPETEIIPVNMESSQSYWEMTVEMVKEFERTMIYQVPLDWSSASYPLAFAALNHEIHFPGLKYDRLQSDAKFLELLKEMGHVRDEEKGTRIGPSSYQKDISLDVSDCLDLVPALGYYLAHIKGRHELRNVKNLVFKESDRLHEVIQLLKIFGRDAFVEAESLIIQGHPKKITSKKELNLPNDHRIVMSGALFLRHHSGGSVSPMEAVAKSYVNFFYDLGII
jgi:3-phosphoshikimate 1-carboxyvinyltransferase